MSDYYDDDDGFDVDPGFADAVAAMQEAQQAAQVAADDAFDWQLDEAEQRWAVEDQARIDRERQEQADEQAAAEAIHMAQVAIREAGITSGDVAERVWEAANGLVADSEFQPRVEGSARVEAAIQAAVQANQPTDDVLEAASRFMTRRRAQRVLSGDEL